MDGQKEQWCWLNKNDFWNKLKRLSLKTPFSVGRRATGYHRTLLVRGFSIEKIKPEKQTPVRARSSQDDLLWSLRSFEPLIIVTQDKRNRRADL